MKKLMILGAGIYQVPLIKKAKEMGIYTIVSSINGNYPGFKYADIVYYEDTRNKERILDICKKEMINGIVTCGTDVAVPAQGYVCDQMNLCGPTFEAAIIAQDKVKMKEAFMSSGVRTAEAEFVNINNSFPEDICEKIGYPVIFKIIDSSGSRGITKVRDKTEIDYAYKRVIESTGADTYIIEKYLEGVEFGAQAFILAGSIRFVLPHGDYVFNGDSGVPVGHFVPIDIDENTVEDANLQLVKAIQACGLDNCAINADFILCDGKVYVLEIGARAGATCLVEMTSIFYGFDYYEKIIQASLGIEADFSALKTRMQPNAEILLTSPASGYIKTIDIGEYDNEHVLDLSLDYCVGDHVRKFSKGPDRIGHVIAIGDSVEEAKKTLDDTIANIKIEVEMSDD